MSYLAALCNSASLLPLESDVYLSFLPFSHIYERVVLVGLMYSGASMAFITDGDVANLNQDLKDVRPTLFAAVP